MDIYIFDRELNFIGITDGFTSLRWTRRYHKSGDFELHCIATPDNIQLLQREYIIYKKGSNEAGYIETKNIKSDTEGREIIIIKGKFLTSYLNRRIIWGTMVLNTTAEVAMYNIVRDNCVTPINQNRIINNLILGDLNNFQEQVDYQVSYAELLNELENLSSISNLGYRIDFDVVNRKIIFKVFKGVDRSVNQTTNPKVIFSKEFENILEQEYTDSLNNYKNLVLVGGIGDGVDRKLTTVGDSSGLDRFEIFNDQKNLSNEIDRVPMSDADYLILLAGKGNETLTNTKEIKTFTSKINLNSNLIYGVDFDLGDIVTLTSIKWGITLDSRITETEEVYEENGLTVNIVFGNTIPTLIDKIKNMSKQQSNGGGEGSIVSASNIDGGTF